MNLTSIYVSRYITEDRFIKVLPTMYDLDFFFHSHIIYTPTLIRRISDSRCTDWA